MKIALVILHADATRGGAERYTVDLADALATAGHDVSIVAASGADANVVLKGGGATRPGQYKRFLAAVDDHLSRTRYDIVHAMLPVRHCDIYHPHAGVAAEAIRSGHEKYANPLKRRLAEWGNRLNWKRQYFAEVERELLTGSKPPIVLCLSNYIKDELRRHYTMDDSRMVRLLNGVDLSRFDVATCAEAGEGIRRRYNIAPDHVLALMVAQDFARKGLHQAIEAMAHPGDPRLRLLVVGRDSPEPYARHGQRLGLGDRVIFAGPTTDTRPFYAAADFFILPTRHDPCSLVVIEALAMGLPVISTAQNGACEYMTDGQEGLILPDPMDIPRLTDAIQAMLGPSRRQRMGKACLALRPKLSSATHVSTLLEIYDRVLRHRRAGA
jgi:UDP-glucose:(heptosyl)LPS alpha-1,3-glucosyltransferase